VVCYFSVIGPNSSLVLLHVPAGRIVEVWHTRGLRETLRCVSPRLEPTESAIVDLMCIDRFEDALGAGSLLTEKRFLLMAPN
jgi:hypothetical protein